MIYHFNYLIINLSLEKLKSFFIHTRSKYVFFLLLKYFYISFKIKNIIIIILILLVINDLKKFINIIFFTIYIKIILKSSY